MEKQAIKSIIKKIPLVKTIWDSYIHAKNLQAERKRIKVQDKINRDFVLDHWGNLSEIEIETLNRCNGVCSFCPVNANEPQREYHKMSDELFRKIIDDLAELQFTGNVSLFSNNEPFLDDRIIEFHKYAYDKLPDAKHCLYTNGSLLTLEKFMAIIPYLDYMNIDNYNVAGVINESIAEVYEYIEKTELKNKVSFSYISPEAVRHSRGGQAPNKKNAKAIDLLCMLPYRQMIIRPDGKVSLCCNDALGKYTLGDLNDQTIMEVWHSEEYEKIRKEMWENGRSNLLLCRNCDTPTEVGIFGKLE